MNQKTEEVDMNLYRGEFAYANILFKSGKYEEAGYMYLAILSDCPVHIGARNNYVLSLAYQGDYRESLRHSILLGITHPEYEGNYVNILIPLYALGHGESDYYASVRDAGFGHGLDDFYETERYTDNYFLFGRFDNYITEAYAYNRAYADMELAYGADGYEIKMAELTDVLTILKNISPDDTDYAELYDYFEGLIKIRSN